MKKRNLNKLIFAIIIVLLLILAVLFLTGIWNKITGKAIQENTVTIYSSKSGYISQQYPTKSFSNLASSKQGLGYYGQDGKFRTSSAVHYEWFNLSSIPSGATIISAKLYKYHDTANIGTDTNGLMIPKSLPTTNRVTLAKLTENFLEKDTYSTLKRYRNMTILNKIDKTNSTAPKDLVLEYDVKDVVQYWVYGKPNYGFSFLGNYNSAGYGAANYYFRNAFSLFYNYKPKLVVTYSICIPETCSSLNKTCGSWDDTCGGTLNCGDCASGYECVDGACNVLEEVYHCPGSVRNMLCDSGSNESVQDINYTEDNKIRILAYSYPKSVSEGDYFNITLEIKNKENLRKNLSFYAVYDEDKFELISNLPSSLILEPSQTKKLQMTFKAISQNVYPPKNDISFVFNNKEYVISLHIFIGVSNDFIECGGVKFPKSYYNGEGSACNYYDSAKCCNNVFYPSFECCSDSDCNIGKKCVDGICISKYPLHIYDTSGIPKGNIKTLVILSSNEGFSDEDPCLNKKEQFQSLVNGTENYFDKMAKIYLNERSDFINFDWTFIGNFNIQDLGLTGEVDAYEIAIKAADYCNLNIQNYREIIISNPSQTQWCSGLACVEGFIIMIVAPGLLSSSLTIPHEIAHTFGCRDLYVACGGIHQWGNSLMSAGGSHELPENENLSILDLGDLPDLQVCRGEMGWADLDNNNILEIYEIPEKLEIENIESYFKEEKIGRTLHFNLSFVLIMNNSLRKQVPGGAITSLDIRSNCYLEIDSRDIDCRISNDGTYITNITKEELINLNKDTINLSFTYKPYLNKILQTSIQVPVSQILQD